MTSKELLYIEDALGHENFMKSCACKTSKQILCHSNNLKVRYQS